MADYCIEPDTRTMGGKSGPFYIVTDSSDDDVARSKPGTLRFAHFGDHEKVMLFGADDHYEVDKEMKITLAYNHFGKKWTKGCLGVGLDFPTVSNDYTLIGKEPSSKVGKLTKFSGATACKVRDAHAKNIFRFGRL
ncbi:hypothetical protein HAX54_001779 [Datura stramonium]|uniref:Uncharacterized protein n=1 Tax=Datura stramonium TaxID=4076 RepID=A0ABS8WTA2_DATST|nr:hypothetical protein [Datura stramonium]